MELEKIIQELEERIKFLEEKLNHIVLSDNNTITISSCSFGTVAFGDNCEANFHNSSAGSVINGNFEDAEDKLDEIESRIDDAESRMDELESRIDENE
jgi:peptidoglycan hydrolase CwlO-like protein